MEKMLQVMMGRFRWFIAIGFMIVVLSLIIGAVNASNAADYYAADKATRDASVELAQIRSGVESIIIWLPYLKFLGLAMILAGITMALGVIAMKLQKLGKEVLSTVPENVRLPIPPRPVSVHLMRMFMMLGMLIIIVGFIVSLSVAGTAADVYSRPVTEIDAASAGSVLLDRLATVHSAEAWLEALKFVGMGFLFLGIVSGLHTIVLALRFQQSAIPQVADKLQPAVVPVAVPVPAPATGD